jgi:hypothetical protein
MQVVLQLFDLSDCFISIVNSVNGVARQWHLTRFMTPVWPWAPDRDLTGTIDRAVGGD